MPTTSKGCIVEKTQQGEKKDTEEESAKFGNLSFMPTDIVSMCVLLLFPPALWRCMGVNYNNKKQTLYNLLQHLLHSGNSA